MPQLPRLLFVSCALALGLSACTGVTAMNDPQAEGVPGFVTDLAAFETFITTRPTPEDFRRHYPDVTLVLPGELATKEYRMNNSRYFAELDAQGRISGGRFQ